MTPGIGWGEDGDGGADVAVAGGVGQVIQTGLVDFFLGMKVASIDNIQFGPKKASDTADTVSPGEPTAVVEFGRGERVGPGLANGLGDLAKAKWRGGGSPFFGFE